MKKKILSFILTLSVVFSMFTFFGFSASADQELIVVTPVGDISVPSYTEYYEVVLRGFTVGETYDISLYIQGEGWGIVQSFGSSGSNAPKLTLLNHNATQVLCEDVRYFKTYGYGGRQTFFQYDFGTGGTFTLRITPSSSNDIRLTFTMADGIFDEETPISTYEDITYMTDGTLRALVYPESNAFVGRYHVETTGSYPLSAIGYSNMKLIIVDPSSTVFYDCIEITGEVDTEVLLYAGIEYYLVLFIPDGYMVPDFDCVELVVTIG